MKHFQSWLGTLLLVAAASAPASKPMNVVFILIDDLGWRDLGCYGSTYYPTPNIDRLASEGMKFTDAYAACNVCSPTRAAIMTGKYPARLLLTQWLPSGRWDRAKNRMKEGRYVSNLPLEEYTIAEALRDHGYRTGFMGKWHLGPLPYYYPQHQGFDINIAGEDYGAPGGYFHPFEGSWTIPTTGQKLFKPNPIGGKKGDYLPDLLSEHAVDFIGKGSKKPFFLFLSHYAVHTPLQAKPGMVKRYNAIPEAERQGNPKYAAMVESVDQSVGRVLKALRAGGMDENTLVIFTSDNGGFAKATRNAPLRANKGSSYEGGIRVPLIIKWPNRAKAGSICHTPVISTDFFPTILEAIGKPQLPHRHMDGESLVPLLTGKGNLQRDAVYWHYPHYNQHPQSFPASVIRQGEWKLIENLETGELELYDLSTDIGEQNNLATTQSARTSEMHQQLRAWRKNVGAEPMLPNPEFQ